MEPENAFRQHPAQPSEEELRIALGPAQPLWSSLVATLVSELGITGQEWKSSGPKYGWSLRLQVKKRNIVYLGPCPGCFRVALVLGEKAVAAARCAGLPPEIQAALDQAPRYPEGTGLRLLLTPESDLAPILSLAAIKLRN